MLYGERMCTAILTSYLQAPMRKADGTHKLDVGQKSLYPDEILVLIAVLQVLTWHFNFIEFLESELTQWDAVGLQADRLRATIKFFLEFIPPFPQLVNVLVHSGLLCNKILLERASDVWR